MTAQRLKQGERGHVAETQPNDLVLLMFVWVFRRPELGSGGGRGLVWDRNTG